MCDYWELHHLLLYDGDCERLDDVNNSEVVWVDELFWIIHAQRGAILCIFSLV